MNLKVTVIISYLGKVTKISPLIGKIEQGSFELLLDWHRSKSSWANKLQIYNIFYFMRSERREGHKKPKFNLNTSTTCSPLKLAINDSKDRNLDVAWPSVDYMHF